MVVILLTVIFMKNVKNKGRGIRVSESTDSFLSDHNVGTQRIFEIGLACFKLSVLCPLSHSCIYLARKSGKFSRHDLPCEKASSASSATAQESRPIGWMLCPVRAAFIQGPEYVHQAAALAAADYEWMR